MHELLYPVCQAYDSVFLNADVEVGGTDQKFNILMGRDLQTQYGQEEQVGLFMPILTGLDGVQKMSKSLNNYVGITESPKEMFGKLMSISDEMMPDFFELCTDVPMEETRPDQDRPGIRQAAPDGRKEAPRAGDRSHLPFAPKLRQRPRPSSSASSAITKSPRTCPKLKIDPIDIQNGKVWIVRLLVVGGHGPVQQRGPQADPAGRGDNRRRKDIRPVGQYRGKKRPGAEGWEAEVREDSGVAGSWGGSGIEMPKHQQTGSKA